MSRQVKTPQPSNKPVIWALFAAGGTVTAFLTPVLVLLIALAVPVGILPAELFAYERLAAMLDNTLLKVIIFVVLFLSLWHAAHRLRITAHDFGLRADGLVMWLFYTLAVLGSVILWGGLFT